MHQRCISIDSSFALFQINANNIQIQCLCLLSTPKTSKLAAASIFILSVMGQVTLSLVQCFQENERLFKATGIKIVSPPQQQQQKK